MTATTTCDKCSCKLQAHAHGHNPGAAWYRFRSAHIQPAQRARCAMPHAKYAAQHPTRSTVNLDPITHNAPGSDSRAIEASRVSLLACFCSHSLKRAQSLARMASSLPGMRKKGMYQLALRCSRGCTV